MSMPRVAPASTRILPASREIGVEVGLAGREDRPAPVDDLARAGAGTLAHSSCARRPRHRVVDVRRIRLGNVPGLGGPGEAHVVKVLPAVSSSPDLFAHCCRLPSLSASAAVAAAMGAGGGGCGGVAGWGPPVRATVAKSQQVGEHQVPASAPVDWPRSPSARRSTSVRLRGVAAWRDRDFAHRCRSSSSPTHSWTSPCGAPTVGRWRRR